LLKIHNNHFQNIYDSNEIGFSISKRRDLYEYGDAEEQGYRKSDWIEHAMIGWISADGNVIPINRLLSTKEFKSTTMIHR